MANISSTVALNIQANTQKALNQFKSFSSDIQNKFLISGLQLDFVRNALSSINREFERYAGGGGLSDAIQTQQLTRSLQTSLSTVQGYSIQVGKALSENIGLALSKINTQVGGNKSDIAAFTNQVGTAINEQVALGLTGTKNLVAANEQVFGLMQKLKLGYGVSIEEQSGIFEKILLNQMSMDELMDTVSSPVANLLRTAAFQSGGQIGNMSGVNRGAFLKKVEELSNQFLPNIEELVSTNPEAILGRFMNRLFDDRIGIFGMLRKIDLGGGKTTTIMQESIELLNSIFGEDGFIMELMTQIAKSFGMGAGKDGPAKGIIALIDWFTETINDFTSSLRSGGLTGLFYRLLDLVDELVDKIPVDRVAETLSKVITKFSEILAKALDKVPETIATSIKKTIEITFKGLWGALTGQETKQGDSTEAGGATPAGGGGGNGQMILRGLLAGGLLGGIGLGAFGIKSFLSDREEDKELKELNYQRKLIRNNLEQESASIKLQEVEVKNLARERGELAQKLKKGEITQDLLDDAEKRLKVATDKLSNSRLISAQLNQRDATMSPRIGELEGNVQNRKDRVPLGKKFKNILKGGIISSLAGMVLQEMLPQSLQGGETGLGKFSQIALPLLAMLLPGPGWVAGGAALAAGLFGGKLGDLASGLFGMKYNGNFPIAANGLFGAMNKESLMSGNKGLVIANQDEIIVPPHRMAQLAGMVTNMGGAGRAQYALNDRFKQYQDEQKKQMRELIREVQIGNSVKRENRQGQAPAQQTINNTTNQIDGKAFAEGAPKSLWDNISSSFMSLGDRIKQALGIPGAASGNIPMGFLQAYKSEMNAYGGRPLLANDKELIVSPRNYSTFASLLRSVGSNSRATIQNEININISSSGEIDTNKITNAVMKAIDNKYAEAYRSISNG